jgi:uncharacterized heparinase superfamily protein
MPVEYVKSTPTPRRTPEEDAELWARLAGASGEDTAASPIHRLKIAEAVPTGFAFYPAPVAPPDTMRGESLMKDIWRIGADKIEMSEGLPPWTAPLPSRHFADRVHRFDWLADVIAQGDRGGERARGLVDDWIANFGRFNGFAWRTGCAADRVWNWMLCGKALFGTGEEAEIQQRLDTLARQLRHLEALQNDCWDFIARWRLACVRVLDCLCLQEGEEFEAVMEQLANECTAQILPDGGHVTRAPARGLQSLLDLCVIRDAIEKSDCEAPSFLTSWIERLGGMVRFFRGGDGALAPFNDSDESLPQIVDAALSKLDSRARRFMVAPKSGFHKIVKGPTVLILDAGEAPPEPFGDGAHAGALSFELQDGESRLVTSCGYSPEADIDWRAAVRRTDAHSTLILSGDDSAPFLRNEATGLTYPDGPDGIFAKRMEEAEEIWLDAQHGGYKRQAGLLHRRRLFIAADGGRLTGEDSLARPLSQGAEPAGGPIPFAIRFHLHPTVDAVMEDHHIALKSDFGIVWRFKTSHTGARIEKTVYLSRGVVEKSKQIVLGGRADPNSDGSAPPNCVRWAFLRDDSE